MFKCFLHKINTMKKNIILSAILIASSIITLNSCKKKQEIDNETQSVVDNALCERQFMAIQPAVNEKGISEKGIKRLSGTTGLACDTFLIISGDTTDLNGDKIYDNGPVTFQIDYDYGTVCSSPDGSSIKSGKINITTPNKWSAFTNSTVTVDLLNYKVDGITYSGQIKIKRPDAVTLTVDVINGHCTDGNWNIDYSATKTMKQIAGVSTPSEADDEYEITGGSSGKNREGRGFSTAITVALHKKSSCKFISSGTLDLTPDGFKTRTVDFGNGTCDDKASYTVNGQTVEFILN